ncbi:hypothetical protein [Desulfonema ishimotonii]|uniref:hypothetical protein n=1 Tax=Desulfonema ishimotonii TaxID=45657 RepID=UPI000F58CD55|nr:hypothetical protein [Desulfonema ishimotonii]
MALRHLSPSPLNITATLMDLSPDGMGLTIRKTPLLPRLGAGDHLMLIQTRPRAFSFLSNTELEIKWSLSHSALDHMAIGCEFIAPPRDVRLRLRSLIASWPL